MVMFFQAFQRGLIFLRNLLKNLADLYENNLFLSYLYEFLDAGSHVTDPLTVNDNIRFGNIDLASTDPESVQRAAGNAGADQIIQSLPKGYQTILGKLFKDGVELSIGQWQMIAIARAFMRNARLIVLDEPTSSLDPIIEYEIFSRFKDMLKNKSAVLISHRFSTVQMADRIVALKTGRIVEQGTHQNLMRKNGYYAHLFEKQADCFRHL